MSDRFTIVFKGDIRAFDGNPLHVVSPFGEVVAGGVGDEFAVADALRAENARLIETNGRYHECLQDARDFIATTLAKIGDGHRIAEIVTDFDYLLGENK